MLSYVSTMFIQTGQMIRKSLASVCCYLSNIWHKFWPIVLWYYNKKAWVWGSNLNISHSGSHARSQEPENNGRANVDWLWRYYLVLDGFLILGRHLTVLIQSIVTSCDAVYICENQLCSSWTSYEDLKMECSHENFVLDSAMGWDVREQHTDQYHGGLHDLGDISKPAALSTRFLPSYHTSHYCTLSIEQWQRR